MRSRCNIGANIGRKGGAMTALIIGIVLVVVGCFWFSDVLSDLNSL